MGAVRARVWAAVAVMAASSAMPAAAAELGFYVGFLYGDGSKEPDVEQFDAFAQDIYSRLRHSSVQHSFTTEEDGQSYGFLAGYRLTQYLAFEGGYLYAGKQSYRDFSTGFLIPSDPQAEPIPESVTLSLTTRTTGFTITALGVLPLSYSWEAYARAGALFATNTLSLYAASPLIAPPIVADFTESSTDWLAGVGVSMSLAEVYSLRAEFTRIFDAGAEVFGEADFDLISIGVTVSF